jgi:hypothetical protein
MIPHPIALPNGRLSHSLRITRLRVLSDRSPHLHRPFVEIWEGDDLVYEGPIDLASLSRPGPRPPLRVVGGGAPGRAPDSGTARRDRPLRVVSSR